MATAQPLLPGCPAPWFVSPASNSDEFHFSSAAGRHVVLLFFGSSVVPGVMDALALAMAQAFPFDDRHASLFGVSVDAADREQRRLPTRNPGVRHFWDVDGSISRQFGALTPEGRYRPFWLLLDPMLRVLAQYPLERGRDLLAHLEALPPPDLHAGVPIHAPVLILPRVFDTDFCRTLIDLHQRHGGEESGFMRDVDGRTIGMIDHAFKRRRDVLIEDEAVRAVARRCIKERLLPEIHKAFQFRATRMERFIVACYDGADQGFFRPHRDNTTAGTAHRKFAVTINLNAEEFEGGELRFPEFGSRTYRAPTGGAVVFSCTLLHEATPVTKGRRFAFLPFLYDEDGADLRRRNQGRVGEEMARSGSEASAEGAVTIAADVG